MANRLCGWFYTPDLDEDDEEDTGVTFQYFPDRKVVEWMEDSGEIESKKCPEFEAIEDFCDWCDDKLM